MGVGLVFVWRARLWCAAVAALALFGPVQLQAQSSQVQSQILTIESERLFAGSLFGKRTAEEFDRQSSVLASENRAIEEALTAEERELTERRATMTPAEFRTLADAFDEKVQGFRREQDAKVLELSQRRDAQRVLFSRAARPILERLMLESGAVVLLERESVLLSSNATDVTDTAIGRIDAAIGDGAELSGADDLP